MKEPKPAVVLFHFPTARRAALVRSVAHELRSRSYDAGKRYWAKHIKCLSTELKNAGLSRVELTEDLKAYAVAVRREVFSSQPERVSR
ncbi:DUF6074 family protein [Corticibacterium sp. UT-5YL-CI-8]|nr:DUF6074 family protein [Tianweitania sp. UT-5YL-CI-8]